MSSFHDFIVDLGNKTKVEHIWKRGILVLTDKGIFRVETDDKNKTLKAWVDGKQAIDIKLDKTASGKVGLWAADIGAASFDDVSINGTGIPATAVQPNSKLSTKWGSIKAEY